MIYKRVWLFARLFVILLRRYLIVGPESKSVMKNHHIHSAICHASANLRWLPFVFVESIRSIEYNKIRVKYTFLEGKDMDYLTSAD